MANEPHGNVEDRISVFARLTIEELMAELVDRIAAEPTTAIEPRAWEQLRRYAPYGLQKFPVAFRYKNAADVWVYTEDEAECQHALDTGHDSQKFVRSRWHNIKESVLAEVTRLPTKFGAGHTEAIAFFQDNILPPLRSDPR